MTGHARPELCQTLAIADVLLYQLRIRHRQNREERPRINQILDRNWLKRLPLFVCCGMDRCAEELELGFRIFKGVFSDVGYTKREVISSIKPQRSRQKIVWNLSIVRCLAKAGARHDLHDRASTLGRFHIGDRIAERIVGTSPVAISRDTDATSDDDIEVDDLTCMLILRDEAIIDLVVVDRAGGDRSKQPERVGRP